MRNPILRSFYGISLAALLAAGCSSQDGHTVGYVDRSAGAEVRSDEPRSTDLSPTATVRALTADNAAFGIDFLHAAKPTGNFIISPHSLSVALAMTYAGARGTTHDEMASTMHFTLPEPDLHQAFNTVDLSLNGRSIEVDAGQPFKLRIADSTWGQKGTAFVPAYLDTLARYYGAGLETVDFASNSEGARNTINQWVSEKTETKIPDLLQPGMVTPDTRLVLVNAVYFFGSWLAPFDKATDGTFQKADGTSVTVPMMHLRSEISSLAFASGDGWQALEIPYVGEQETMVVLLPDAGQFATFAAALDGAKLNAMLDKLALVSSEADITLPKFRTESSLSAADALMAMGMRTAFTGSADFSGMTGGPDLSIADVIHRAIIKVDENGTEAAAATAVTMWLSAAPRDPLAFKADRPFLYVIRDKPTGAVLFLGQVVDPSV